MSEMDVIFHDDVNLAMGTLAGNAAVSTAFTKLDGMRSNGFMLKKMKYAFEYHSKNTNEGPVLYGLCMGGISGTEIKDAIEADPQHMDDVPKIESTNREVFPIGLIPRDATSLIDWDVKFRTLRWPWKRFSEVQGLNFWMYNTSSSALTQGGIANMRVVMVGRWILD